jgi:hypothetical protein
MSVHEKSHLTNRCSGHSCFSIFGRQDFAKSQPKKYDFNKYEGYNHGNNDPNLPNCEEKKFQVPVSSQEYKRILVFFSTFMSSK